MIDDKMEDDIVINDVFHYFNLFVFILLNTILQSTTAE